jgi:O-antigen/teichoic acid export membrane protein
MGDQALISATNFLMLVLVARTVGPTAFGVFALVYTVLLFANSLQFALITQPHNVLAKPADRAGYVRYTSTTAVTGLVFSSALTVLVMVGAVVTQSAGWGLGRILWAAAPALFMWQLQDFCRRVLYSEGRLSEAFINDLVSYGGQLGLVAALWRANMLSGPTVLYASAVTSLLAAGLGAWQLRRSLAAEFDWAAVKRNWRFGKWLGIVPAYWLAAQGYMYLAAAVAGVAAAGALKAAQVLMGPLHLFFATFESVLPIRFAAEFSSEGSGALSRMLRQTYLLSTPIVVGYALLVSIFSGPLMEFFYGRDYARYAFVLPIFAAYYVLLYAAGVVSAAIRAMHRSEVIFNGYALAAGVSVMTGIVAALFLGPVGAVLGMAGGSLTLLLFFTNAYARLARRSPDERLAGTDGTAGVRSYP